MPVILQQQGIRSSCVHCPGIFDHAQGYLDFLYAKSPHLDVARRSLVATDAGVLLTYAKYTNIGTSCITIMPLSYAGVGHDAISSAFPTSGILGAVGARASIVTNPSLQALAAQLEALVLS
jgi:hypothetical protein